MTLSVERDGPVTTLIRDRREARNAMDPASAEALTEALLAFDRDDSAFVAVLWGAGGAFCAGFDLKYAASQLGQKDPMAPLNFPEGEGAVPRGPMGPTRLQLSKPVIAAVAGPAVAGGMELALWCDLRVMEESAYMGVYCRRWGVPLIDGGTVRLAAHRRARHCARSDPDRPQGDRAGMPSHRPVRARGAGWREPRRGASAGA